MKFLSSLKAWKKRGNIKQIRRGKQVILIDPANPKLKVNRDSKENNIIQLDDVFYTQSNFWVFFYDKNASSRIFLTSVPPRPDIRK